MSSRLKFSFFYPPNFFLSLYIFFALCHDFEGIFELKLQISGSKVTINFYLFLIMHDFLFNGIKNSTF